MKRLGMGILAVAAVTLLAGRAEAQIATGQTTYTITATATIDAILEFDVIDDSVDCDVVLVGDAACAGDGTTSDGEAEILVSANSDWLLTFSDLGGAVAPSNVVTMTNDDAGRFGEFLLDIDSDAPDAANGGEAGVDFTVIISAAVRTGLTDNDNLDVTDDYGTYTGTFNVTLTATN